MYSCKVGINFGSKFLFTFSDISYHNTSSKGNRKAKERFCVSFDYYSAPLCFLPPDEHIRRYYRYYNSSFEFSHV